MVKTKKLMALAAVGALTLAACGSDDDSSSSGDTTPSATDAPDATDAPETTDDMEEGSETTDAPDTTDAGGSSGAEFVIDTENCDDPDAATAPIEGGLKIGTSIPLSGGAAVAFAPFGDGQQAYIDWYNDTNGGLDGQPVEVVITDDQYSPDLTKANVDGLIFDDEVDILSGIIGSGNNLAIQADVNALCVPQLWGSTGAADWGNIDEYPWTTGLLVPYAIESRVWADFIAEEVGDGATAGLFYVNNEFGESYAESFSELAGENGIDIIAEEVIDPTDSGAPSGQMTNLVQADPDAILAVGLGSGASAFMTELGNAKAANPDFDPLVYVTATAASPLFFDALVENGGSDGVYTSSNVKYVGEEQYADDEAVQTFLDAMATYAPDANAADTSVLAGWLSMELAIYVAEQALAAGDLSRAGIMNAARNIDYVPGLLIDGITASMNAEDAYYPEGTQLVVWDDTAKVFVVAGDAVDYNGSLGTYTP
jgi:ABC-type branched-subunit amino acid transport system substrate-binding protein